MSERNDGGPAFPVPLNPGEDVSGIEAGGVNGMSLRDYFAAKAMPSVIADYGLDKASSDDLAKVAYIIADAMLDEREK